MNKEKLIIAVLMLVAVLVAGCLLYFIYSAVMDSEVTI